MGNRDVAASTLFHDRETNNSIFKALKSSVLGETNWRKFYETDPSFTTTIHVVKEGKTCIL